MNENETAARSDAQDEATPRLRFGLSHLFALITLLAIVLAIVAWLAFPESQYVVMTIATLAVVGSRWTPPARFTLIGVYAVAGILATGLWTSLAWLFVCISRVPGVDDFLIDAVTTAAFGASFGLIVGTSFELMLTLWGASDAPFASGAVELGCPPQNRWLRFGILGALLLSLPTLGGWLMLHWGLPAVLDWSFGRVMSGMRGVTPLQEFTAHDFGIHGDLALVEMARETLVRFGVYEYVEFHFERIPAYSQEETTMWSAVINAPISARASTFGLIYPVGKKHSSIEVCDTPEQIEKWRVFLEPWGGRMTNAVR